MDIDEAKIREEYGSINTFCKEENIGIGVYNGLRKKRTNVFQKGSASFKAYKKLKALGFIKIQTEKAS